VGRGEQCGEAEHPGADVVPQPHEGGHERERVREHVVGQRAARHRVRPEATTLVQRLPLRLEEEVSDEV
jgi:hypothetical protein